jgi:KDO2-lipid IV(A) lauroyltransferase
MGLWWLVAQLPWSAQMTIGDVLGNVMARLGRSRARIARINISKCFPEMDEAAREALLRDNFRSGGRALMEAGFTWWSPAHRVTPRLHAQGVQHLQAARSQGQGVLLVVSHNTCLEVATRILGEAWPHCHLLYKANENPVFEWVSSRQRGRYMKSLLPHKKIGAFLQAIREGDVGIYMTDQDSKGKYSVYAPFFGIQAATLKTTADFARQTAASVIPAFFGRRPDGIYYMEIQPPLVDYPCHDEVENATRINQLTETQVRRHPEQYLWQHRRFKHRPAGEAPFY